LIPSSSSFFLSYTYKKVFRYIGAFESFFYFVKKECIFFIFEETMYLLLNLSGKGQHMMRSLLSICREFYRKFVLWKFGASFFAVIDVFGT